MANTKRVTAVFRAEVNGRQDYLVTMAHAGRRDRTGSKVHLGHLTVWPNGNVTTDSTYCSGNGALRGSLVGGGFAAVTCQKCIDVAARLGGRAVEIDIPAVGR